MSILCRWGHHKWEKEPSCREKIRETGRHLLFWSEGVQKAVRRCTRAGCAATQKVTRCGFVGAGGEAGLWRRLSPEEERHIDSLPVM